MFKTSDIPTILTSGVKYIDAKISVEGDAHIQDWHTLTSTNNFEIDVLQASGLRLAIHSYRDRLYYGQDAGTWEWAGGNFPETDDDILLFNTRGMKDKTGRALYRIVFTPAAFARYDSKDIVTKGIQVVDTAFPGATLKVQQIALHADFQDTLPPSKNLRSSFRVQFPLDDMQNLSAAGFTNEGLSLRGIRLGKEQAPLSTFYFEQAANVPQWQIAAWKRCSSYDQTKNVNSIVFHYRNAERLLKSRVNPDLRVLLDRGLDDLWVHTTKRWFRVVRIGHEKNERRAKTHKAWEAIQRRLPLAQSNKAVVIPVKAPKKKSDRIINTAAGMVLRARNIEKSASNLRAAKELIAQWSGPVETGR